MAAGEGSGGHVGAGKEILFLDFVGVEKRREALAVEESDDIGIEGNEGARRHVCPENGGLVFLNSGFEEFVFALIVKVVLPVFPGANQGEAVVTRDFAER